MKNITSVVEQKSKVENKLNQTQLQAIQLKENIKMLESQVSQA